MSAKVDKKLLEQRLAQGYGSDQMLDYLYNKYHITRFASKKQYVDVMANTGFYDIPPVELEMFNSIANPIRMQIEQKVRGEAAAINYKRRERGEAIIDEEAISKRILSELLLKAPKYEKAYYEIEKRWHQYQKREQLMITGQYVNIRASIYRENYIQALENNNVPRRLINALKRMSLDQWIDVSEQPNADSSTASKYRLPVLQFFYEQSDEQQRSHYIEMTEQLESLLIEKGLLAPEREVSAKTIEKYGSRDIYNSYRELIRKSVDNVDTYLTRVPLNARRKISASGDTMRIGGKQYNLRDTENIKMALLDYRVKSLGFDIKTSKAGNPYIPFTSSRDARMLKEWRAKHK